MRETGVVKAWNPERGFGFVQRDGAPDLFLHIKAFPRGAADPAVGDEVTFEVEVQPDGKPRAAQARLAVEPYVPPVRPTSPIIGTLTILAFAAIYSLVEVYWGPVPLWVLFLYLGVSAITFGAYAIDKSAARLKQRRIAETSLILLGMLGGLAGGDPRPAAAASQDDEAELPCGVLGERPDQRLRLRGAQRTRRRAVARRCARRPGVNRPGFFRRVGALLIDYALILGWMVVVAAISAGIALATGGYADWLAWGVGVAELLGFVVLVLPVGDLPLRHRVVLPAGDRGQAGAEDAGGRTRRVPGAGLAHPDPHDREAAPLGDRALLRLAHGRRGVGRRGLPGLADRRSDRRRCAAGRLRADRRSSSRSAAVRTTSSPAPASSGPRRPSSGAPRGHFAGSSAAMRSPISSHVRATYPAGSSVRVRSWMCSMPSAASIAA